MKWISVKDQLPEDGQDVLIFIDDFCIAQYIFTPAKTTGRKHIKHHPEKREFDVQWRIFDAEDVTHWMPLPEPPEI